MAVQFLTPTSAQIYTNELTGTDLSSLIEVIGVQHGVRRKIFPYSELNSIQHLAGYSTGHVVTQHLGALVLPSVFYRFSCPSDFPA